MPLSVTLLDPSTAEFQGFQGHVGIRSKLGLMQGKWVWKLEFTNIGRKYAWAGTPAIFCMYDFVLYKALLATKPLMARALA